MGKYKRCPRCELNYILVDEDLCPVCKTELKLAPSEEEEDLELCSICGKNLITVDQVMCDECAKKRSIEDVVDDQEDSDDEDGDTTDWDEPSIDEQQALEGDEPLEEELDTPEGFSDIVDFDDDLDDDEEEDEEYQGSDDDFEDIGNIDDIDIDDDDLDDDDDDDFGEDFIGTKKKK